MFSLKSIDGQIRKTTNEVEDARTTQGIVIWYKNATSLEEIDV
jgi:hypothetical protein